MTPAILGVGTYSTSSTSAFISLVVAKVTTAHPRLESSRSFKLLINTQLPKRLALLDTYHLLLFLIDIHLISCSFLILVYSVYLGYKPEGLLP